MTSAPLRIGLLLGLAWDEAGGVQRVTRSLAREFMRQGHAVSILAFGASGTEQVDLLQEGAQVRLLSPPAPAENWATFNRHSALERKALHWCVDQELDVVHLQNLAGFGLVLPQRLRELGRAVFASLHDDSLVCPRGQMWSVDGVACEEIVPATCSNCWQRTWPQCGAENEAHSAVEARLLLVREALEACSRVFVPSLAASEIALGWGAPAAKLELCPNGVEPPARLARRRAFDADDLRLAVLGSVQPSKGVLFLARLVAHLGAPFHLELHGPCSDYHGDRSHLDELEALAASSGRVKLHGAYLPHQLPSILCGLDLVCVPSLWHEVHGLAAREAALAGLPVFVAARGGLLDMPALQLPAGDAQAWSSALKRFVQDEPWRIEQSPSAPQFASVQGSAQQHLRAFAAAQHYHA